MKKEAQEEARQRATKAKARRHQVSMVQVSSKEDDDYVPPMLLPIGINHANNKCNALLDSGADINVMAAHIYEAFVTQTLTSTTSQLNNIANQSIDCHGMTTASIYVNGHKENFQFYVTKSEESAHDVILGRSWMSQHRCQLNWEANSINLVFGIKQITLPTAAAASDSSDTPGATQAATTMPPKQAPLKRQAPRQSTYQRRRLLQSSVQAHLSHKCNNYIWVPKDKIAATTYDRQRQFPKTTPKYVACQRWIPKTWLQAQNFYKGNKYIWVPQITKCKSVQTQEKQATPISLQQNPRVYLLSKIYQT